MLRSRFTRRPAGKRRLEVGEKMHIHESKCSSPPFESEGLNKMIRKGTAFIVLTLLVCMARLAFGGSEKRRIDLAHSTMTVYVYKTGLLSDLAHNHEIGAPIEWGEVKDSDSLSVELRVDSTKLRVLDSEVSDGTHDQKFKRRCLAPRFSTLSIFQRFIFSPQT
jgi:hypothetical protein